MTSLFSLSSNPLATPVGALIDRATDSNSTEENVDLFYEVCEMINAREENAKDAMKAIRKKLSIYAGRNWSVVTKTLNLIEICSHNCTKRFLIQLASKEFLQELKSIIGPKLQPPLVIQEKVLMMIKQWAKKFEHDSDFKAIEAYYQELRSKGIDFPVEEQKRDVLDEISTSPKNQVPIQKQSLVNMESSRNSTKTIQRTTSASAYNQSATQSSQSIIVNLNDTQIAKLNSELDVVESNIQVFNEILNATPTQSDLDLLSELNRTCKEMQARMTELVASISNEKIINEILRINDDLNNVFVRYSRFERQLQSSDIGSQAESLKNNQPVLPLIPARLPTISKPEAKVIDKPLIDFGDENPEEINAKMASLSFGASNSNDDPNAFLNDENEIKEMENWLKSQGMNVETQNETKK